MNAAAESTPSHPLQLCAHLGYQFNEFPPLDRIGVAARAGFKAIEWPSIYEYAAERPRESIDQHGVCWVQVTLPAGNAAAGEKGLAALPGREEEFGEGLQKAIHYAKVLGSRWIHPMAGVVPGWTDKVKSTYLDNLRRSIDTAKANGLKVMVEVIGRSTVPGYALGDYDIAEEVFAAFPQEDALGLLLDTYHAQTLTGDLPGLARKWAGRIAHVQIADVPGRHEPGTGAIDFDAFFAELRQCGYDGWIGCEYRPATTTLDGLRYLERFMRA